MTARTVCTTQAEVDAAAERGDLIIIDSTWRGSSRAELWGSSRAVLRESSSAVLRESSSAELRGSSSAELRGRFAGARLIGPDATADGTGQIYRIDTPAAMADYCGLDIDDGHITLYKAVSKDGTGGGGHHPIRYEIEAEAVAPDWDPDPSIECGVGLHLSPSITQARDHNRQAVQVLACRVALVDIAVYEPSLAKVRCRAVTPYEVVWTADEQKEDER